MIELQGIAKDFGKEQVLQGIGLQLPQGQTLSVLGRSGCGKTTLLKIMAGLETASAGSFRIEGKEMLELKPQARGVVYLSQEPLLFPHMTVAQNIGFGLQIRKVSGQEIKAKVEALLAELGLEHQAAKFPEQLSGGQKQRAAFGRAIIIEPKILLLDEPFGSLDSQTRAEMQALFGEMRKKHQITSLFVTHDLREALTVGDQFARMEAGKLQLFASQQGFLEAADEGMRKEMDFWRNILDGPTAQNELK
jgi:putrescine transport system ATP-binding protein